MTGGFSFGGVGQYVYGPNKISEFDKCVQFETVTPGSIIKDKVSTYINSPERQLELADDINKVLNTLFSTLISKLQNQGLSSLSTDRYEYTSGYLTNTNMGVGYGNNNNDIGSFQDTLRSEEHTSELQSH